MDYPKLWNFVEENRKHKIAVYNKILTLTHPSKNPYVSFSNLITKDKFVTMHENIKWERRNKLRGHDQNIAVFSSISYP